MCQNNSQHRARAYTGEGLDLMRCHGQGQVCWRPRQRAARGRREASGLTINSSYVLAMDSSLHHEVIAMDAG